MRQSGGWAAGRCGDWADEAVFATGQPLFATLLLFPPLHRQLMQQLAGLADQGVEALREKDWGQLARLMHTNFSLRRQIYGDAVVGAANLALVEAAASVGAAAKLTGSGGAVVALCPDGQQQAAALRQACAQRGLACEDVVVAPWLHWIGAK